MEAIKKKNNKNYKKATMLVFQTSPVGVELFFM